MMPTFGAVPRVTVRYSRRCRYAGVKPCRLVNRCSCAFLKIGSRVPELEDLLE